MAKALNELTPKLLWENFQQLCKIPRPSKNETQVAGFVIEFAKKHQLECFKDDIGNVIIKKPATKGNENKPVVVMQAHLDMVPQKNADKIHDFDKDSIEAYLDGEWVKASGTTLGADNGIGVAAALAVMASTDIQHGPLEVLLTIDEETGMTGAFNIRPGDLNGSILMNLDSEDEGELYIGCAGGVNTSAVFTVSPEPVPSGFTAFKIALTGLKGGHSGLEINLGRGNANKLMNRFLWKASREFGLRISSISGGTLRNAIPRESFVIAVVPASNETKLKQWAADFKGSVIKEIGSIETAFGFEVSSVAIPATIIDAKTQNNLLNVVYTLPNGVIRMESDMPGVVETSTNLAIIQTVENTIEIHCLLRSSIETAKMDLCNAMTSAFELAGAPVEHSGSYPGWKPNVDSKILHVMKKVYEDKFGKTPDVKVIHAGLECGIIGDVYNGMDMVSFGPTIRHPHSPDEKVNIPSVEKFWTYLIETLKAI
jgi:dipeptidase D